MTRKAALANLTVHVVDPARLEGLNMGASDGGALGQPRSPVIANTSFARHNSEWAFLADLTDGRRVTDDNSPERVVAAILDETSSYYVLAFQAADPSSTAGRSHDIDVRVARRNVTVQHRSQYQTGQTPAAREAAARQAPLLEAVGSTMPRTGLPLALALAPFATPGLNTSAVAVTLRLLPAATPPVPGAAPETVSAAIAALDPVRGRVVGSVTQQGTLPVGVTGSGGYELLTRLNLAPGRYEIRAALDMVSGDRGSVYGFVEVPKFGDEPLSLSGVALHVSPEQPSAPNDALTDLLPVVPTARRTFLASDRVTAFLRAYRGAGNTASMQVTARVLDARGRAAFENTRGVETDYTIELPLSKLTAGEYLLSIDATSGVHKASRAVPFRVQ